MSDTISPKPMKVGAADRGAVAALPAVPVEQRLARRLARPHFALPVVILSLALLAWSAVTYHNAKTFLINARPRLLINTNMTVTPEALAELQENARSAAQRLIRERAVIARNLSRLEQQAHALGFQVELSVKPAVTNAAGFGELTIYPALIVLENDNTASGPAFLRLLTWLHEAAQISGKVEVANLILRSKGDGLAHAEVELNFWSIDDHGKPAAK